MKTAFIAGSILVGALVYAAHADGIPYDPEAGEVTVRHRLLTLDADQAQEVEVLQTLTLSATQWAAFRKEAPTCPKRLGPILKRTYNDCLCGVDGAYGIQLTRTSVAVPLYQFRSSRVDQLARQLAQDRRPGLSLAVDSRGQFHSNGLIRYPDLVALLKRAVPVRDSAGTPPPRIGIRLPVDLTPDAPVLASRLAEIRTLAERAGLSLFLY